jgi:hypothetical protein
MTSVAGSELIILCPTKDEAIVAAETWGEVNVDPAHIKRAMLGPVVAAKAASKEGK